MTGLNVPSNWRWIETDGLRNGCGTIQCQETGRTVRVVVQDLITTKHRVAFENGKEVARAGKYTTLLRKLNAQRKEPT